MRRVVKTTSGLLSRDFNKLLLSSTFDNMIRVVKTTSGSLMRLDSRNRGMTHPFLSNMFTALKGSEFYFHFLATFDKLPPNNEIDTYDT